jgi:CHAT domain-containing protein/Tfp pilus assembly protein PilF
MSSSGWSFLGRWVVSAVLSAGVLACGPQGPSAQKAKETAMSNPAPAPALRIEPGQKQQERPLAEKETHPYLIHLEAGEYIRVAAEQRGVDLTLRLLSPSGELITEMDSPTGDRGAERVSEVAFAAGDYRFEVVGNKGTSPGKYEIRIEEKRAATEADRRRVEGERTFLEGEELRRQHKEEEAIARYERAQALWKEAGDLEGQARALYSIGWMNEHLEHLDEAVRLCTLAADLYQQASDTTGQAQALNRSGRVLFRLGSFEEAQRRLEEAVRLFHANADSEGEDEALHNLANVHNQGGRFEQAVDTYQQLLTVWRGKGDRGKEATTLLALGVLYLEHGKLAEARDNFESALRIAETIGDRFQTAEILSDLGELDLREERLTEARAQNEKALTLFRDLGDRRNQAITLNSLGLVLLKAGDQGGAQARFSEALALHLALGDAQGEAMVTANLGRVALTQGDAHRALGLGTDALKGFKKLGDRRGLSFAHYVLAQALLKLGEPDQALHEIEASLGLAERQRTETASLDVRAFYFATRQHYWELYIDILMRLDQLHPNQGFAEKAFEADERRRARSLLDALTEVRAEARKGADPALLREEDEVRRRLERATRPEETDELLARLDRVRTRMRQASPHLARIEGSEPLSLAEIRKRLLDTDTLLLVYSLGEERSFLWKVTRSTFGSFSLPGREPIETAAWRSRDVLAQRLPQGSNLRQTALADLADLVLKPVVADLPKYRRLLIVADGALQRVPFAALPDPAVAPVQGRQPFLIEGHPIIYLPSASVGATLRKERHLGPLRGPGPLIAVLADPVFDASDSRVHPSTGAPRPEADRGALSRSMRDVGMSQLDRLLYTRKEAEAIQSLWRPGEVLPVFDFAASRDVLKDDRWLQAPILHFATHSLLDDRQPALSGLVFSQVDPDGTPRTDGFLRLLDIYGLSLKADLVVLSACETGVGKEMRGEGLLGITRGFMSIGVPQMVVSLWKVEDQATAELMGRFYKEYFDGKRPPEALQKAQKSMLLDPHWSDPALWAGFIFLGDYERMPGGDIEARDTGGMDAPRTTSSGGLPPPKIKPPRPKPPKPKPPGGPGAEADIQEQDTLSAETARRRGRSPGPGPGLSIAPRRQRPKRGIETRDTGGAPLTDRGLPPPNVPPDQKTPQPSGTFKCASCSPLEIRPETWHTLLAYCFREESAQAVAEDSARRLGTESGQYLRAQASTSQPIATGNHVVIVPELAGCHFNPPQASFFWFEDWHCAELRFQTVPGRSDLATEGDLPGRLSFYVNAVLVADIPFQVRLTLSPRTEPARRSFQRAEARPYQSVFISYSHDDTWIVEVLEEAYAAVGLGLLRDIRFLRPGEEWQPKLLEKIDEADIFQLFWSNRARRSRWVKAEWQHALSLERPFFIRPVYLENPMPKPPKELTGLHFHHLQLDR